MADALEYYQELGDLREIERLSKKLAASEAKCADAHRLADTLLAQCNREIADANALRAAVEEREMAIVWAARKPHLFLTLLDIVLRAEDRSDADLIRVVIEQSKGGE